MNLWQTKMKKQTEIEKTRLRAARTQGHPCPAGHQRRGLNLMQYEMGLGYLYKLYGADDTVLPHEHSPMFWLWWKQCWRIRDGVFLSGAIENILLNPEPHLAQIPITIMREFIAYHTLNPAEIHPGMHIMNEIDRDIRRTMI